MNNNENAEYNNTLHFHVYNILCLHIIDNLTNIAEKRIIIYSKKGRDRSKEASLAKV